MLQVSTFDITKKQCFLLMPGNTLLREIAQAAFQPAELAYARSHGKYFPVPKDLLSKNNKEEHRKGGRDENKYAIIAVSYIVLNLSYSMT